ncbi:hypothetical protein [Aliamphritea spongicola]|nr:hypothetical protein [Aliamphritea spongicola]
MLPVNRRRTQIMLAGSFLLLIALVWVKVPSPLIAAIALLPACLAAGLQMPFYSVWPLLPFLFPPP